MFNKAQNVVVQVKTEVPSPVKPNRRALRETQTLSKGMESQQMNQTVQIKKEKVSNMLPRRETQENMPPPPPPDLAIVLKKENVRSTRTRTRKQKELAEQQEKPKYSDVIIQNTTITTVDLCSDEEKQQESMRSTRTRTRNATKKAETSTESNKRSRSASEESQKSKSSKVNKTKKKKGISDEETSTSYEDAVAESPSKSKPAMAQNDPNVTQVKLCSDLKDIMTDDESPVLNTKQANKTITKSKPTKPLFSPFDHSPVKKKVEAFEKLGATASSTATPTRETRNRGNVKAKEKNEV